MNDRLDILLAEDDQSDVLLLRRAFKEAGVDHPLQVARDGQEAIELLSQRGDGEEDRLPMLVILDLKMPRRNGIEVLQWIRSQPALCCIPIFIFSSSAHPEDVERAYAWGANSFIVKPPSTVQRAEIARFIKDWLKFNRPPLAATEGFKVARALHAARAFRPVSCAVDGAPTGNRTPL